MRYNTAQFEFFKDANLFAADMSDFNKGLKEDWGTLAFELQSQWTGKVTTMRNTSTVRDSDGCPTAWIFTSTDPAITAKFMAYND